MNPSKSKVTVLCQIAKLIPRNLISKLANKYGVSERAQTFSPTSHILSLIFAQLTHALGLNDVCDTLNNHSGVNYHKRLYSSKPQWVISCQSQSES